MTGRVSCASPTCHQHHDHGEEDRGVPGGERAGGRVTGHRPDQQDQGDERRGPPLFWSDLQIQIDVVVVDGPPEHPEQQEDTGGHGIQERLGQLPPSAEVVQGRSHDGRWARWIGPRRARRRRLLQKARQPGQEEDPPGGHRERGPPRCSPVTPVGPPPPDEQQDADRPEKPERPVVGQQKQARCDSHAHQLSGARLVEGAIEEEPPDERERQDQAVHAGLGGVAHRERRHRQYEHCQPGHRGPAPAATDQPDERERQHGEHAAQGPHRGIAVAEHLHPAVKQQVVERWVAVVAQRLGDVAQRQGRDVDAQGLVEPERRGGREPGPDTDHGDRRHHVGKPARGSRHPVGRGGSVRRASCRHVRCVQHAHSRDCNGPPFRAGDTDDATPATAAAPTGRSHRRCARQR